MFKDYLTILFYLDPRAIQMYTTVISSLLGNDRTNEIDFHLLSGTKHMPKETKPFLNVFFGFYWLN